ncbi:hypothetical protein GAU_2426 [Gemmatimonas aurantiaca T-27]|uniref:Uncharacterized protein n=2 Tax=Gemmatimonas aurantiaca TaxID=173480 RepID=C1AB62_GEMAT|nr:ankyrin repeat domain-containing protein [Gemmatimonas aurantiaca]BAH39468.1 hypothetical protein GAU_2426 [Gemmatimonas aurantiaca T-27]
MYPNPQDVLPLPQRPDTQQYRTRAKDLVRAYHAGGEAVEIWARQWVDALWRAQSAPGQATADNQADTRDRDRAAQQVTHFARQRLATDDAALHQAQFVIARAHGFPSWPRFVRHLTDAANDQSTSAIFEQAADAIVRGDLSTLLLLLRAHPALVRARSTREHEATLLHYVSANGVENYRQRTPANIVVIATALLDAGADVNATCEVYGGGADTLGLVVTSAHPRAAGVQLALTDLLVARGAPVVAGMVRSALANGCPEAAAHVGALCVARGIALRLDELAGMGLVEPLEAHLSRQTPDDRAAGEAMQMAAWYGRGAAIATMLDHGLPVDTPDPNGGETALHTACYAGHEALVAMLLERGASVHRMDTRYGTTPLVWALHAWLEDGRTPVEAYRAIVHRLLDAGAVADAALAQDERLAGETTLRSRLMQSGTSER